MADEERSGTERTVGPEERKRLHLRSTIRGKQLLEEGSRLRRPAGSALEVLQLADALEDLHSLARFLDLDWKWAIGHAESRWEESVPEGAPASGTEAARPTLPEVSAGSSPPVIAEALAECREVERESSIASREALAAKEREIEARAVARREVDRIREQLDATLPRSSTHEHAFGVVSGSFFCRSCELEVAPGSVGHTLLTSLARDLERLGMKDTQEFDSRAS